MESNRPDRRLWTWVALVTIAGLAVLAYGVSGATSDDLKVLLLLLALGALAERYAVGLFDSHISVGVVAVLAAAILGGLWGVALVAPAIVLIGQLRSDAAWYKRAYNAATYTLAGAAFAAIFELYGDPATPEAWPVVLVPALLGALANYAINSALVATAIALSNGEPIVPAWRKRYGWMLPQYLIIGLAAMATATAYHIVGLWGLAVFAAPVAGIRHAYFLGSRFLPREQSVDQRAA
ncbi:MAG: hypothetical protein IH958_00955 [Chloroflexi bacterium]|nr:hypothetical protein [Chloroflexota bacterium]